MRVLGLHGGGGNANIMRGMTSMMQRMLGSEAQWDFIEGDTEYNNEGAVSWGSPDFTMDGTVIHPSQMDMALAKGTPLRGWWVSTCDAVGEERKRHWLDKLGDPYVGYTYSKQAEAQVDRLLEHLRTKGPFDCIVTFSQASVLVLLTLGILRERGEEPPWSLSVCFSPMAVRDSRFHKLFQQPLDHPIVLCFSQSDWAYRSAREVYRLPEWFAHPVVLEHGEGHKLPSVIATARELYAQIVTEMWSRCGAELWQVVGGAGKGGIVVRGGRELASPKEEHRLATGALIRQIELQGERLRFEALVTPKSGPTKGWVSLTMEGKPLVAKAQRPPSQGPAECAPLAAPPLAPPGTEGGGAPDEALGA